MLSWRRTEYCFRIRCPFGLNREFSTPLFGKAETVPPLYEGARSKQCHWIYSGKAWAKPWTRVRRTAWLTITVRNRKIAVPASDGKGIRHKHFPMLWFLFEVVKFHIHNQIQDLHFPFWITLQEEHKDRCLWMIAGKNQNIVSQILIFFIHKIVGNTPFEDTKFVLSKFSQKLSN